MEDTLVWGYCVLSAIVTYIRQMIADFKIEPFLCKDERRLDQSSLKYNIRWKWWHIFYAKVPSTLPRKTMPNCARMSSKLYSGAIWGSADIGCWNVCDICDICDTHHSTLSFDWRLENNKNVTRNFPSVENFLQKQFQVLTVCFIFSALLTKYHLNFPWSESAT